MSDALRELRDALRAFPAERDWDQFHSPRNLAAALSVEAAELWLRSASHRRRSHPKVQAMSARHRRP